MSFLSRGKSSGDNDDEDLVRRQLTAIGGSEVSAELTAASVDLAEPANSDRPKTAEQPAAPESVPKYEERSVLQQGITITGSIASKSDLFIYGVVDGNVSCESDVTIDGTVNGNILARGVQILGGSIKGDIESQSDVTILKGAVVRGNIKCVTFSCDSEVNGNMTATGKAVIKENGVMLGDIVCAKISVGEGAILKGNIQTNAGDTESKKSDNKKAENRKPVKDIGSVSVSTLLDDLERA